MFFPPQLCHELRNSNQADIFLTDALEGNYIMYGYVVGLCCRNKFNKMDQLIGLTSNTKECARPLTCSFVLEISHVVTAPNRKQYYTRLFSKIKIKQDDGDVFWWIIGHVSLLKLEKYVEDDNR